MRREGDGARAIGERRRLGDGSRRRRRAHLVGAEVAVARHLLRALEARLRLDVLEVELAVVSRDVEADAVVGWVGRPVRAVGGGERRLLRLAEEDLALRVPRRAQRVERVHHPRRVVAAAAGRAAAPLAAHLAQRPRRRRDQVERRARVVGVHNQHVLAELGGLVPGRGWGRAGVGSGEGRRVAPLPRVRRPLAARDARGGDDAVRLGAVGGHLARHLKPRAVRRLLDHL